MQVYMGGMDPTSTVFWKKSSCITIYLSGCDFRCPNCNTPELTDFKQEHISNILDIKREINRQASFSQTIVFSGGEPCLQRQALLSLARHSKEAGLEVGIQTNGTKPETIQSLIRENLLDFIEMDLKAPFDDEKRFEGMTFSKNFFRPTSQIIEDIKQTLRLLKKNENEITIIFKTLLIQGITDDFEFLKKIAQDIKDIKSSWILTNFNNEKTLDKEYKKINQLESAQIEFLKEELRKEYPMINIE